MRSRLNLPSVDLIKAEKCRRSLFFFMQEFWDVVITETPVYNWHMQYLCDQLQKVVERVKLRLPKEYDVIINIPPGTSKSTICTQMLPSWAWTIDPSLRILTASYSSSLSTDHAVKSRDIIRSERYRKYFPEIELKKDQDNKTHYKNTKGGERYATSVGGTVTGFHAHIIIVDDPINPKEASSEADRDTANEFMDTTLSTRKVNKSVTPTILVMQRLHEKDPTGNWLGKKGKSIQHICLPGMLSKHVSPEDVRDNYVGGLLDPVRLGKRDLKGLKIDLGSYGFAGQIQQTPTPIDGGIWKRWIIPIERKKIPRLNRLGTDWDLAYTENEKNSASAFVESGKSGNNMYITDLGFDWLEFPSLIKKIRAQQKPHYIEAKASGKSAKQTLSSMGVPSVEVKVKGGDKIARTQMATPYAEAGMVFCAEDIIEKLYNDDKQGILLFPNAEHDDLNDALVQAINRHFSNTLKVSGNVF